MQEIIQKEKELLGEYIQSIVGGFMQGLASISAAKDDEEGSLHDRVKDKFMLESGA